MTARKNGRRVNYMLEFATVRYWQGQLNESGIKNSASNLADTRLVYLTRLAAFNEWLPGRIFDMRVQAVADGRIVRETVQKSFANVEEMLRFGDDGSGNEKEVRKIISQYLRDPRHVNLAHSTMAGTCSAIKSYFDAHDVATNVKFNGKKRAEIEVTEEPELEIADFYKMMTANKVDLMVRAVMLVKFQAGLDSSTLADRFNFYAYQQITKWCGTDDHNMWGNGQVPDPGATGARKDRDQVHHVHRPRRAGCDQDLPVMEGGTPRPARSCQADIPYHAERADTRGMDF